LVAVVIMVFIVVAISARRHSEGPHAWRFAAPNRKLGQEPARRTQLSVPHPEILRVNITNLYKSKSRKERVRARTHICRGEEVRVKAENLNSVRQSVFSRFLCEQIEREREMREGGIT
jgi:hypothetical protein